MSKVMPWLTYDTYRNDKDVKQIVDSHYKNLFIVDGATPEQVRQVCALPEIMAALRDFMEAENEAVKYAALSTLYVLYERLR
jgi:hypothetical protein